MTAPILVATVAAATAAVILLARRVRPVLTLAHSASPRTALEHAEAILASRYARGSISAQEYRRTLAVLRR